MGQPSRNLRWAIAALQLKLKMWATQNAFLRLVGLADQHPVSFQTRLNVEECREHLLAGVDVEPFLKWLAGDGGTKPIIGKFEKGKFRLQSRCYRFKIFVPFFHGRLSSSANGTVIEGDFRIRSSQKVAATLWLSFPSLCCLACLISVIAGQSQNLPMFLICAGMVAFGILFIRGGRWGGRGGEWEIVEFLKEALDVVDVPGQKTHGRKS
jgi:hypothetical protein